MPEVLGSGGFLWHNGGEETDDHLVHGGHEWHIVEIAKSLLPNKGVFLDVGAHVGLYTLNLALKASLVYAVEANPMTHMVLKDNLARNYPRIPSEVRTFNLAAWDHETTVSLRDENGKSTGGSTHCHEDWQPLETTVDAHPLDEILPFRPKIDLVKIDVEGAEGRVLRGMKHLVWLSKPTLLIEMHDKEYSRPEIRTEVLEFLEAEKYDWDDSLVYGGQYYIVAHSRDKKEKFEIETVKAGQ